MKQGTNPGTMSLIEQSSSTMIMRRKIIETISPEHNSSTKGKQGRGLVGGAWNIKRQGFFTAYIYSVVIGSSIKLCKGQVTLNSLKYFVRESGNE